MHGGGRDELKTKVGPDRKDHDVTLGVFILSFSDMKAIKCHSVGVKYAFEQHRFGNIT